MQIVWLVLLIYLGVTSSAGAVPIINITGESYTVGATLPDPNPWCTVSCGAASGDRGLSEAVANCDPHSGLPSLGTKCMKWNILANQVSHYSEIQCGASKCTTAISEGDTLFLAYQMNYTNTNGDVWQDGPGANSADKGPGLHSTGTTTGGFRWDNSMGCWDGDTQCQDHRFTVWIGNPNYHFNIGGCGEVNDIYHPNVAPYTGGTVPQLAYNRWHNFVMKITMSNGSNGRVEAWVDGAKYLDCASIKTMDISNNDFSYIEFGGTIAQPAYDTPAHTRFFDNIVVTKTQSDITDFFSDPEAGSGDTTPPAAPTSVFISKRSKRMSGE